MQNVNKSLNETLQAKYPHLELSVLSLSQVQKDNESSRIDSEYFKKEYLENEAMLLNLNCEILGQITEKICNGSTPENGEFENQGIPFFRSQDFDLLDTDPKQYVKQEFHNTLSRSKVKYKDILIAIIGATLGKIGFVKENIVEANINQNIAKVSIKNEEFNPYFVATFLDTYYGQYQIFRLATQTAQEYLNNIQVAKIKVPKFSQDFQLEIQHLVQDSHRALEDSKVLYKEAERFLYESLGLDSHNPLESLLCDKSSLQDLRSTSSLRGFEKAEAIQNKNIDCHESNLFDKILESRNDGAVDCHDFATQNLAMTDSAHSTAFVINTPPQTPPAKGGAYIDSISLARGDSQTSPSLAEGARGWVNPQEKIDYHADTSARNDNIARKYPHLNLSIRSLSQSYGVSGRLDSEYYQTKYDAIERKIKSFSHKKLGDLVTIQKSIEPGSEAYQDKGVEFVRVANLSKFGISKSDICLNRENFAKELEKLAPKKDTILLSKDGSIGISYCLEEDLECITSGAILQLKVKDKNEILPQVLSLILNSIAVKLQAERDSGGSIIAHWKISEIENVLIPLLDLGLQEQIASKIQKSFALRAKSKSLLESAKAKVEQNIQNRANQS